MGYKTDFPNEQELFKELKKHKSDTNLQMNLNFWKSSTFVTLNPLIDLVNHYQP
jgi:hypothetical protein